MDKLVFITADIGEFYKQPSNHLYWTILIITLCNSINTFIMNLYNLILEVQNTFLTYSDKDRTTTF